MVIVIALITSGIASIIAGFFGSGAGMVAVPVLSVLLKLQHIPSSVNMHVAIGTTLAFSAIFMTASAYEQHKHGAINWTLFKKLIVPTVFGILVGSFIAGLLSSSMLRLVFGLFLLIIAIVSLFKRKSHSNWNSQAWHFKCFGFLIAISVGLVGTGIITIPFLRKYGLSLVNAIAMSVTLGVITASVGGFIHIISGWQETKLLSSCIGYVDWQLLIPFSIGSIACAKFGVRLSHKTSPTLMHYLFCGFVLLIAIKMLW